MSGCCEGDDEALALLRERQRGTLWAVLGINGLMFFVIVAAGWVSGSAALLSDSFDDLGDAVTYALSLAAVAASARRKAQVALVKGGLIALGALGVAAQVGWRLANPAVPVFELMGGFGLAHLAANGLCLALLTRVRDDDINMSSVWECSRNDIASNLAVFAAAGGVWLTGAGWPDLVVAAALLVLLSRSAWRVIRGARAALRGEAAPSACGGGSCEAPEPAPVGGCSAKGCC